MKGRGGMNSSLFLDLDGTLVNSQMRLYKLFCMLCRECKMTYSEYWSIKRQRISQAEMLKTYFGYNDEMVDSFHKAWLEHVEDEALLEDDFPVEGITERLESLSKRHTLYLLTARQNSEFVKRQMCNFGWNNLFLELIVTHRASEKCEAVRCVVGKVSQGAVIGDTGEDVKTAKELGLRSIAVGWGILSPAVLIQYNPDFLAERIEDLDNCPFL